MTSCQWTWATVALVLVAATASFGQRRDIDYRLGSKPTVSRTVSHEYSSEQFLQVSRLGGSSSTRKGLIAHLVCAGDSGIERRVCRVYLEDFRRRDRQISKSCELAIKAERPEARIPDKFDVTVVSDDLVVVAWYERLEGEDSLRLSKLRPSDCRSSPIEHEKIHQLEPVAYYLVNGKGDNYLHAVAVNRQQPNVYFGFVINLDREDVSDMIRLFSAEKFGATTASTLTVQVEPVIKTLFSLPFQLGITLVERISNPSGNSSRVTDRLIFIGKPDEVVEYGSMEHPANHGITFTNDQSYTTLCNSTSQSVNCTLDFTLNRGLNGLFPTRLRNLTLRTGPDRDRIRDLALANTGYGPLLAMGRCPSSPWCAADDNDYKLLLWRPLSQPELHEVSLPRPNCDERLYELVESGLFENKERDHCVQTLCRASHKFSVSVVCVDFTAT